MSSHGSHNGSHDVIGEKPHAAHGIETVDTTAVKVGHGGDVKEGLKEKTVHNVSLASSSPFW